MALDFKKQLIKKLKAGDRNAQYTFYNSYADAMYNICVRMLKNEMDAQDVLQASFIKAFTNIDRYNYQVTPGAWLKRIVINNCINHLRKKKLPLVELESDMISQNQLNNDIPEFDVDMIQKAMENLAKGYQIVLQLYLFEGYDHQEIGDILGISPSTSKSQYSRAKQRLKLLLLETSSQLYRKS